MSLWLWLMACGGSSGPDFKEGTLIAIDQAPVNCTLRLEMSSGVEEFRASHSLCRGDDRDRTHLAGQRVKVTFYMVNIQKESCAGKTSCMDLEEVYLASEVEGL